jgi:hypothetical protein
MHMRALIVLAICASLASGCALSKEESTLAKAHDAAVNKPKVMPPGTFSETQMGVHYYPGADLAQNRQYDEGGYHFLEQTFGTPDSTEKVRDFYEKEIGAKAMPLPPVGFSVQKDKDGKHYDVSYGRFNEDTTITVKVSWPSP